MLDITIKNLNHNEESEIRQWLSLNCKQKYYIGSSWINSVISLRIEFKDVNDAVLFKLIWN